MEESFIVGFVLDIVKDIKKFFGCEKKKETFPSLLITDYESDSDTDNGFIKAYKDFKTPN